MLCSAPRAKTLRSGSDAPSLCPQLVVETSTASFHGNTEDTVVTYRWQGDRIWPSSEFLSQDTATRVHAAAAR